MWMRCLDEKRPYLQILTRLFFFSKLSCQAPFSMCMNIMPPSNWIGEYKTHSSGQVQWLSQGSCINSSVPLSLSLKDTCDLLWQNREQVGATSCSLSNNKQCRLFYPIQSLRVILSRSHGSPFQSQRLTLTIELDYYKRSHSWMHCMNACVYF